MRIWGPIPPYESVQSLCSRDLICFTGKLKLFSVHVVLQQGFLLSLGLFMIFMDRIFRHNKGLGESGLMIASCRDVVVQVHVRILSRHSNISQSSVTTEIIIGIFR